MGLGLFQGFLPKGFFPPCSQFVGLLGVWRGFQNPGPSFFIVSWVDLGGLHGLCGGGFLDNMGLLCGVLRAPPVN